VKSGRAWSGRVDDSQTWFNRWIAGATGATIDTMMLKALSVMMVVAGGLVGSVAFGQQHERLAAGA
jgi:hypothetical protein